MIASAPYAQDGWFPEMLPMQASVSAAMAEQMKDTPMYQGYAAVAPRPQDFLDTKVGAAPASPSAGNSR